MTIHSGEFTEAGGFGDVFSGEGTFLPSITEAGGFGDSALVEATMNLASEDVGGFGDSFERSIQVDKSVTDAGAFGDAQIVSAYRSYENMIIRPNVDLARLVHINLGGSLMLYLTDRTWDFGEGNCIYDGQIYEPIILSIGEIDTGQIDPITYDITYPSVSIDINNTTGIGGADKFTSLFSAYDPHFSSISVYEIALDTLVSEVSLKKLLFDGNIEDFSDVFATVLTLENTCVALGIENAFAVEYLTVADYPSADPDDVGKMLPQVWGEAKKVPLLAVDAGNLTTLVSDITASQTSIEVSSTTGLVAPGIIQIDSEKTYYTGISTNTLTGCTRGYNSTDAVEHDAGANVAEIQSYYDYIMGNSVNAIDAVYVRDSNGVDIRQSGNYTAYTGRTGDEHPSYPGVGAVRFTVLPQIIKQINIEVDETIEVDDSINVSDTIGVSTGLHDHVSSTESIGAFYFDYVLSLSGNLTNPWLAINGDLVQGATYYDGIHEVSRQIPEDLLGTPTEYRVCLSQRRGSFSPIMTFQFPYPYGTKVIATTSDGIFRSSWMPTSGSFVNDVGRIGGIWGGGWGFITYLQEVWIEYKYTQTATASPATGVAKSGAASKTGIALKIGTVTLSGNSVADTVIGGQVSADIDGYTDETGDYGGVDTVIQRPNNIFKHMLIDRCGQASSIYDADSYTQANSDFSDNSINLAVVLLEKPNVKDLFREIAFQAQAMQWWEASGHHVKYLPTDDTSLTADETIKHVLKDPDASLNYTLRTDIRNDITILYNREWVKKLESEEEDRASVHDTDPDSIEAYKATLIADPFQFPFVVSATQATNSLQWLLNQRAFPRKIIEVPLTNSFKQYKKGQILNFEYSSGDALYKLLGGLVDSEDDLFTVIGSQYHNTKTIFTLVGQHGSGDRIPSPVFNYDQGTYYSEISVELSTPTPGASIYYTDDGTTPDSGSTLYTTAIAVSATTTIKAIAILGSKSSRVASRIYTWGTESSEWTAYFNNTVWNAIVGSWSGTYWNTNVSGTLQLQPLGSWATGFRPSKMRITHNALSVDTVSINRGVFATDYVSGAEIDVSSLSIDITDLVVIGGSETVITNIEFSAGWVSYFDNSKWQIASGKGTWDGAKWVATHGLGYDLYLEVTGSWYIDFRPTLIRVTISQNNTSMNLWDAYFIHGQIATANDYTSLNELSCTYPMDENIWQLRIAHGGLPFNVTNIEFFGPI